MALHATTRARLRVLLIVALIGLGLAAFLWRLDRRPAPGPLDRPDQAANFVLGVTPSPAPEASQATPTSASLPVETPNAPGAESAASPENKAPADLASGGVAFTPNLVIPVTGVTPDQLLDTFSDARSEGRLHDAIDIPAPAGTPVIAAADGEIVKLFQSERGGTTIYELSTDRKIVFYYAHLQRYADGLTVGRVAKQGEVIGYVGDTGNAGAGNYHLHFSISLVADPKRYWAGTNINPYPLLRK